MKTIIYTYKKKEVVLIEKPRFYFLENEEELKKITYDLMEIDAVTYPTHLDFPCILELQKGFCFYLKEVKANEVVKAIQQASKDLEICKRKLVNFL